MRVSNCLGRGIVLAAIAMLVAVPTAWGATRTFCFQNDDYLNGPDNGVYGVPNDACSNNPIPPMFNRPDYAYDTGFYVQDPTGRPQYGLCDMGQFGSFGNDSILNLDVPGWGQVTNELLFSFEDTITIPREVTSSIYCCSSPHTTEAMLTWTDSTKRLSHGTSAIFFNGVGYQVTIVSGTGVVPGTYTVLARSDNYLTLEKSIMSVPGTDATDVIATLELDDVPAVTVTGANFTGSTKTLTATGQFATYVQGGTGSAANRKINITAGTGVAAGLYTIASKVDDDSVTLRSCIGTVLPAVTVTGANWNATTKTITQTGAFASYTHQAGRLINITGGTGVVAGNYTINSKVDDDSITLIPAASVTTAISVSGANWTAATKTLTVTGGFTDYNWDSGDTISITAGTGVTAGTYTVASKTDADNIVLTGDIATLTAPVTAANWTELSLTLTQTDAFAGVVAGDLLTVTAGTGVIPGVYTVASVTDASNIVLGGSITGGADVTDNSVTGSVNGVRDVTDNSVAGSLARDITDNSLVGSIAEVNSCGDVTDASINGTIDASGTRWARLSTTPFSTVVPLYPSPTVHAGPGSSITIDLTVGALDVDDLFITGEPVEFSLMIRETGNVVPLGEDGGNVGNVEMVGVTGRGAGPETRTPVGGTAVLSSTTDIIGTGTATRVKWTFVDDNSDGAADAVDVSVDGGTATRKIISGYAGNGIMCQSGSPCGVNATNPTPNYRCTLDGLAARKTPNAASTAKKFWVYVDNIVIDAPGAPDPVLVKKPVNKDSTTLTVKSIDTTTDNGLGMFLGASRVTVYKSAAYKTGTIAVTNGSPTVTLSGGTWPENTAGGMLTTAAGNFTISAVNGADLTLSSNYTGTTDAALDNTAGKTWGVWNLAYGWTEVAYQDATGLVPEGFPEKYTFTGLTAWVLYDRVSATQTVQSVESPKSQPVVVSEVGILDDYESGVKHIASPTPGMPKTDPDYYRTYYDVSGICWAAAVSSTYDGSNVMRITDGGWTNGVYAIYETPFPDTGSYYLSCKMHINDRAYYDDAQHPAYWDELDQYQIGALVDVYAVHRSDSLRKCSYYGNYTGLTTGNDNGMPPQYLHTSDMLGAQESDLLVAFSSDVLSGQWNGGSQTWDNHIFIYVDDLRLLDGAPPVSTCSDVPQVRVGGPLRAGETTVLVSDVGESADYVTVYLNGVKKGILDTRTTGQGDKLVTVCTGAPIEVTGGCSSGDEYALRKGDEVRATQSYKDAGENQVEGCPQSAMAEVGTGYNPTGLYVTMSVRETDFDADVGADGWVGANYHLEWIGGQTMVMRGSPAVPVPANKLIQPSATWQSLTYFPLAWAGHAADSVSSLENGDGVIVDGVNHKAAFDALTFVPEDLDTGPFQVYVDEIGNGANTSTIVGDKLLAAAVPADYLSSSFDTVPVGTEQVMFRFPAYLSGAGGGANQLASPQVCVVDDTEAYRPNPLLASPNENSWYNSAGATPESGGQGYVTSWQSLRLEWQFRTITLQRYARITTYSLNYVPSPWYPNPNIDIRKPVTVHLLYKPYDNDGDEVNNDLDNCPAVGNLDQADADSDGWGDACDVCPDNATKTKDEGVCGCEADDVDNDSDGVMDCNDGCPTDPLKTAAGVCGCGVPDDDLDSDGLLRCLDNCPNDANADQADTDSDGAGDVCDECASDPLKTAAGQCGCGNPDTDTDSDGSADCVDECDDDPLKTAAGQCGCGVADTDTDSDGSADCVDECDDDPLKTAAGQCGCGVADTDSDSDTIADCVDVCDLDPDNDADSDGVCGDVDNCPAVANADQTDSNGNGVGDACESRSVVGWYSYVGATSAMTLDGTVVKTEARSGGVSKVEIEFNTADAISGNVLTNITVVNGSGTPQAYTPSVAGNKITLTFTTALANGCYTVTVPATAIKEQLTGDADCKFRVLAGDATGNGTINLGDVLYIKSKVTPAPFVPEADFNNSGVIDTTDVTSAKALVVRPATSVTCNP